MIIGDPYKFSILTQTVKEWNYDDTFCNGILFISVNGNLFPKEVINATLKCDIPPLKEKLKNLTIDKKLYKMSKNKAFTTIYNLTFPDDWDLENDYRFDVTPVSLSDTNCFVFAVTNGKKVRIMAGKLEYIKEESRHNLKNLNVSEVIITIEELNEIVSKLDIYK